MIISAKFQKLLEKIEPTVRDRLIYASHEKTVRTRLNTVFNTNDVRRMGSYDRETSIRQTSDVDLMLIFKRDEVRWGDGLKSSTTMLDKVRDELKLRYRNTEIVRDEQAVVIRFGSNQYPVDIVPSFYLEHQKVRWQNGEENQYPIYAIPDANGWWMRTSPVAHSKYINEADKKSRGKLKKVAKLVKFWRSCRTPNTPLNSFYIEMCLAVNEVCVGPKSYARCFNDAIVTIANSGCSAVDDPLNISGEIPAANTERKIEMVRTTVCSSVDHSNKAMEAKISGNLRESLRQWEIVFNYQLPKII